MIWIVPSCQKFPWITTGRRLARVIAMRYSENPSSWTQGAHARDADDNQVPLIDRTACKFCPIGAAFYESHLGNATHEAEEEFCDQLAIGITAWNDAPGRTIAEVIAKLHDICRQPGGILP